MEPMNRTSHDVAASREKWAITYNQSDVDTIRAQIKQDESAKRRLLFLALIVIAAAMVGAIILLSTSYGLYASSRAEAEHLRQENAQLKVQVEQYRQQLEIAKAREDKESQANAEAQAKLQQLIPAVLRSSASASDVAAFARMVADLPHSRIKLNEKPPDKLFRNWKVATGSTTEVYTLVGGYVDGEWVVHSNLVGKK